MRITRETDYALRMLRELSGADQKAGEGRISVREIAENELIPLQFAYKISKKLEKAGLVKISRGAEGGCRLTADLRGVSLYELMQAMDEDPYVISCMEPGYECQWRSRNKNCRVHQQLALVQQRLNAELQGDMLWDLIHG